MDDRTLLQLVLVVVVLTLVLNLYTLTELRKHEPKVPATLPSNCGHSGIVCQPQRP